MEGWNIHPGTSDALRSFIALQAGVSPSKMGKCQVPSSVATSIEPPTVVTSASSTSLPSAPGQVRQEAKETKNSGSKKQSRPPYEKYGGRYCVVVGCSNNQGRDGARGVMFHKFPRDGKRRNAWVQAVRRTDVRTSRPWQPGPYDVICSEHFYGGKKSDIEGSPAYNPTIFPTHHVRPKSISDEARFKRHQKLQLLRQKSEHIHTQPYTSTEGASIDKQSKKSDFTNSDVNMDQDEIACSAVCNATTSCPTDTSGILGDTSGEESITESSSDKSAKIHSDDSNSAKHLGDSLCIKLSYATQTNLAMMEEDGPFMFEVECVSNTEKSTMFKCEKQPAKQRSKGIQVGSKASSENSLPFTYFNDRQFRAFCGVDRNFAEFLLSQAGNKIKDGRILKKEGKIFLMLAKMKLNMNFAVLGAMFGVSDCQASVTFRDILASVFSVVKDYLIWFDKRTINARMPKAFRALYPDTRAIIDCTEIETEQPHSLRSQVLMYSNYKGRFTYKFLVAVSPSGEITFISKGYGGRATDTHITVDSGFLELIEDGDVILGDKGFPSINAKVTEKGGILVMPPFKRNGRQFSNTENREGYHCASVRVHVERAIRRMKYFKIMKFIPHNMLHLMDKCIVVIAFVTNCFPNLINDTEDDSEDDDMSELSALAEQINV